MVILKSYNGLGLLGQKIRPTQQKFFTLVGALERELGRRMGDKAVIERRLRTFLASVGVMP